MLIMASYDCECHHDWCTQTNWTKISFLGPSFKWVKPNVWGRKERAAKVLTMASYDCECYYRWRTQTAWTESVIRLRLAFHAIVCW